MSTKIAQSDNGTEELVQDTRAFVVVQHGEQSWVVDVPSGEPVTIGRSPRATAPVESPEIGTVEASFHWDGQRLTVQDEGGGHTQIGGKRLEGRVELKAGDELTIGPARVVPGLSTPLTTGGRRALTHHELRERLYEEMARAGRGGRPTSLAMVAAAHGQGGHVATVALHSFRAGDVVGIYAPDEIEFLLPDTPGDTSRAVVERVLSEAGVEAPAGLAVAPADGDNPERLMRASRRALVAAREQGGAKVAEPPNRKSAPVDLIAEDPQSRQLVERLDALAPSDVPVLLTGELSSGKGVFARYLHEHSDRSSGPFVIIRCASLVEDDQLEEAFGMEEGTAAHAEGGTLLLDEIGDLPPDGQRRLAALLDRLETDGKLPFRVVATTHRVLGGLVERGAFEQSLFDRLARGEQLEIPALRNRPGDIIPLAERFAEEFGASKPVRMAPGALARLRSHPWPANVLELRNAIERAVKLAGEGEIQAEHLPAEALPFAPGEALGMHFAPGEGRLREHVDSVERDAIIKALADTNNNQTHAARRLGVSRRALIYKMEKYGLKPPPGSARKPA